MKLRLLLTALTAAAAPMMVPAGNASAQQTARDWTREIAPTPEGGFRMGNPNAEVRVVEYLSLACPHCAHFAQEGMPALVRDHVRTGRVSLELRNYILNGPDVAATLLARCGGPARYFALSERFLAGQPQWTARIQGITLAQRQELMGLSVQDRLLRLAEIGGLIEIATQGGVPAAQARACLADQAAFNRLGQMMEAAGAAGIRGTPTFLINGNRVEAHDWSALQPLIRQAGG